MTKIKVKGGKILGRSWVNSQMQSNAVKHRDIHVCLIKLREFFMLLIVSDLNEFKQSKRLLFVSVILKSDNMHNCYCENGNFPQNVYIHVCYYVYCGGEKDGHK